MAISFPLAQGIKTCLKQHTTRYLIYISPQKEIFDRFNKTVIGEISSLFSVANNKGKSGHMKRVEYLLVQNMK